MKNKTSNSQKELYQLMISSISIQSLPTDERKKIQGVLLELPPEAMGEIIKVLRKEHNELEKIQQGRGAELKQVERLEEAVSQARDAARKLNKAFLAIQESSNQEEEARATEKLLSDLDLMS
jgi:hypothetical protein